MSESYEVRFTRAARRALTHDPSEKIAAAAFAFITGPLASNLRRLGKQLNPPLYPQYSARRGEYRVVYRIWDEQVVIEIVAIAHRRDAYR